MVSPSLPLLLSSGLHVFPRRTMQIVKTNNKKCLLMRIMKMESWIAWLDILVGMFILRVLFFVFARAHWFAH